jgi:hypothetical protein
VSKEREPVDEWSALHFSQSNPQGAKQDNIPRLLRRVAASIASLGDVAVQDITFHDEITDDGKDWPSMTVYYHRNTKRSRST